MRTIIIKYLTDDLTNEEHEELFLWLKKPKNLQTFQAIVKDNYNMDILYNDINIEMALEKVKNSIKLREKPTKRLYWPYVAAASVVLLAAVTLIYTYNSNPEFVAPIITNNNIKTGSDKATLTLDDGTDIVLENGEDYETDDFSSNGEEIIYTAADNTESEIAYNYLTVPTGGEYHLMLSDHTEVWLNSESKLKYPVSFVEGETRNVELIYGEAYFKVSPSRNHKGAKFQVHMKMHDVEVLGTEFNVKAYQDEDIIYTTLVEGEVAIRGDLESKTLSPSQQAQFNLSDNNLHIQTVNVDHAIAWKNGLFSFKETNLKEIMRILSRWYDIDVIFENKDLETVEFIGVLDRNQSIEEILRAFNSVSINSYEINDKTVILR